MRGCGAPFSSRKTDVVQTGRPHRTGSRTVKCRVLRWVQSVRGEERRGRMEGEELGAVKWREERRGEGEVLVMEAVLSSLCSPSPSIPLSVGGGGPTVKASASKKGSLHLM
ncbi:hypothetical protein FQA47_003953, partial [Oryzias melastigma]